MTLPESPRAVSSFRRNAVSAPSKTGFHLFKGVLKLFLFLKKERQSKTTGGLQKLREGQRSRKIVDSLSVGKKNVRNSASRGAMGEERTCGECHQFMIYVMSLRRQIDRQTHTR